MEIEEIVSMYKKGYSVDFIVEFVHKMIMVNRLVDKMS